MEKRKAERKEAFARRLRCCGVKRRVVKGRLRGGSALQVHAAVDAVGDEGGSCRRAAPIETKSDDGISSSQPIS